MQNLLFSNEVNLYGKVIKQYAKEDELKITLEVPGEVREKEYDGDTARWVTKECSYFPQITFKGEEKVRQAFKEISLFKNLKVEGKLLETKDSFGNKVQRIFADSAVKTQEVEPVNEVVVQGVVKETQQVSPVLAKIIVDTRNIVNEEIVISEIKAVFYGPGAPKIIENTKIGSHITLKGYISTQVKENSNGRHFFENFVIKSISKS